MRRGSRRAKLLGPPAYLLHDTFNRPDGLLGCSEPAGPDGRSARVVAWPGAVGVVRAGTGTTSQSGGAELLGDPGLEAVYTAGLCASLQKLQSPSVAQSADVHGGSKAQQFTAAAKNDAVIWPWYAATPGTWYRYVQYARRAAGTKTQTACGLADGGGASTFVVMGAAAYARFVSTLRAPGNLYPYVAIERDVGAGDTVVADDCSLRALSLAAAIACPDLGAADVVAEFDLAALPVGVQVGLALRVDSQAAPANGVWVYADGRGNLVVDKLVAGAWTPNVITGAVSGGGTARVSLVGGTLSLTYKGAAVGTTANVADVPGGTCHGLFATDSSVGLDRVTVWAAR